MKSQLNEDKRLSQLIFSDQGKKWLNGHEMRKQAVNFINVHRRNSDMDVPDIMLIRLTHNDSKEETNLLQKKLEDRGLKVEVLSEISQLRRQKFIVEIRIIGIVILPESILENTIDSNLKLKLQQSKELEKQVIIFHKIGAAIQNLDISKDTNLIFFDLDNFNDDSFNELLNNL